MKILIIDDNQNKIDQISGYLIHKFGSGTMVNQTGSINSAKSELDEGNYDVAIIDNSLPDDEGGSINTIGVPAEIIVSYIQRNYLDTKAIIMSDENEKDDQFLQATKVSYNVCRGVVRFGSENWRETLENYIKTEKEDE
mgnify:CR=1 FL=1